MQFAEILILDLRNLDNPFKRYKAGSQFNKTMIHIFLQKEK